MNLYPVTLEFAVEKPLSVNQRIHWAQVHKLKKEWAKFCWNGLSAQTVNALRADKRKKKVSVTVFGTRELDDDNLRMNEKVLYDALGPKRCGFIVDDSPKWVERHIEWQKVEHRKDCRIRVRIEAK